MKKVPEHLKKYVLFFQPYEALLRRLVVAKNKTPESSLPALIVQFYALYQDDNEDNKELIEKAKEFSEKMYSFIKALYDVKGIDYAAAAWLPLVLDFLRPQPQPKKSGLDTTTLLLILGGLAVVIVLALKFK